MEDPFLVHKAFKRRKGEKQNLINFMLYIRLHNHGINYKIQNPFMLMLKAGWMELWKDLSLTTGKQNLLLFSLTIKTY